MSRVAGNFGGGQMITRGVHGVIVAVGADILGRDVPLERDQRGPAVQDGFSWSPQPAPTGAERACHANRVSHGWTKIGSA